MWTVGNGNTTPEVGTDFMKYLISMLFATSLVASEYHGTFFADTLTVTNTLYFGSDSQNLPEIRIPQGGILHFKNSAGAELLRLEESSGLGNLYVSGIISAYNGTFQNYINVASTIYLGNNNTTLTAANVGSLSVGSGVASGAYSFAANGGQATGANSFAANDAIASGASSHAENGGIASGVNSHAEGTDTLASGYASHAAGNLARADHDYTFVWSDSNSYFHSSTNDQFSVNAANGIRLLGGVVQLGVGIASLATNAVNGAASGWTNTTGVNSFVAVDGIGVTYKLYNNAGTVVYTNTTSVTHDFPPVQAGGSIVIIGGTSVKLRALGF